VKPLAYGVVGVSGAVVAAAALALWGTAPAKRSSEAAPPDRGIGIKLQGSALLRDLRGDARPLESFVGRRLLVLAFLGVDCPLANRSLPRLIELERRNRQPGVQFVGIYANEHETIDDIAAHAHDMDIPFPVLKDMEQRLADALHVQRTPTFCVLDDGLVLRYRGRLSDQYGVAYQRAAARREDLAVAIDELLAGRPVSVATSENDGCLLDRRVRPPHTRAVTYSRDIAPILSRRCTSCHRSGGMGPFELASYDDAVRWSEMLVEVVTLRRMPPWHADARHGRFANDRRMADEEIDTLVAWARQGMERGGDAEVAIASPAPQTWSIGEPDMLVESPREFEVPADGVMPYQYSALSTAECDALFDGDRWIQAAELLPSEPSVVHHITVFFVPPGKPAPPEDFREVCGMVGWAPGTPAFDYPIGCAMRVPRGAQVVFEVHYTPRGRATRDRPRLALRFASQPPPRELKLVTHDHPALRIPPGDPHYRAELSAVFTGGASLVGLVPHMHLRGKSFMYEVQFPGQRRDVLLSVPRYDFNWQILYWLAEPLAMPKGTRIKATAHWDNSRHNTSNPDPTVEVTVGPQSSDEMMVAWMFFAVELAAGEARADQILALEGNRELEAAVDQWRAAVRDNPQDAQARYQFALALRAKGQFPAARQQLEQSVALRGEHAASRHELASLLAHSGDLSSAIEHGRVAVKLNSQSAGYANDLGVLLLRAARFAEAAQWFSRALALSPDDPLTHHNLGLALAQQGQVEDAIQHYGRALDLKPENAEAHRDLGVALVKCGRTEEALVHFARAADIRPELPEPHFYLGIGLAAKGDTRAAIEAYRRALRMKADWHEAANNLAWTLATSDEAPPGGPEEAIHWAQQACQGSAFGHAGYLDTLSVAYAQAGRFAEAIDTVTKALDLTRGENQGALRGELEEHLALYRAGRPYRQRLAR